MLLAHVLVLIRHVIELHFLSCLAALQPDEIYLLFLDEFGLFVGGHTACTSGQLLCRAGGNSAEGRKHTEMLQHSIFFASAAS